MTTQLAATGSSRGKRASTHPGALFSVSTRWWQRIPIRTLGIFVIVLGCFMVLVEATKSSEAADPAARIAGPSCVIVGAAFVWLAHGLARVGLAVGEDEIWVYPAVRRVRRVALADIDRVAPAWDIYGGIAAYAGKRRAFAVNRIMLGYAELVDYLRARRPDLRIYGMALPFEEVDAFQPGTAQRWPEYAEGRYGAWAGSGMEARLVRQPGAALKKARRLFVEVRTDAVVAHFPLDAVRNVTTGRAQTIETVAGEPVVFFGAPRGPRGGVPTPGSVVGLTYTYPATAAGPAFDHATFAGFAGWVSGLPEKA